MFSEKTKDLANKLRQIQEQLDASIRNDLGLPEDVCHLCINHAEQIWFSDDAVKPETVMNLLPVERSEPGSVANATHLYYKIGNVPFVTVIKDSYIVRKDEDNA